MLLPRHAALRQLGRMARVRPVPLPLRTLVTTAPNSKRKQRQQEPFAFDIRPPRLPSRSGGKTHRQQPARPRKLRPSTLPRIISQRLDEWSGSERVARRLADYGFTSSEAASNLREWRVKVQHELDGLDKNDDGILEKLRVSGWDTEALTLAYESGAFGTVFEAAFLRHFLKHCSESGPEHLRLHLRSLLQATDLSTVAQDHVKARSINRHFHLHMGPTNSGKTYNALKALAAADTGVYAGPLRLLAHEVWERVNLGSVGGLDGQGRACNLLTGEERRIVETDAGLVSCTVEMLPIQGNPNGEPWDVVVIDEIQMLGDAQRGGAWTNAVMGANAKKIHLCGDETTADLLRSMIDTFKGDTLTVHRYERLTPLRVADDSLDGDWNKVQPGDCIVTFSRSNVFAVKKAVEGSLGKKCAVVYGALPPETRAEQARDFNDESGRAEIMVASDAVGMGLNLKIGRIVFEAMTKFDGKNEVPLSLSQVKQIAGRAGRFGQSRAATSGSDDAITDEVPQAGGVVTTLHEEDLPLLRAMLPLTLPPIRRAVMEVPRDSLASLAPLLPPSTSFGDLLENFVALAKLPPNTVLNEMVHRLPLADIVEPHRDILTLAETTVFCQAPLNHRDPKVAEIFSEILTAYADSMYVDLESVLQHSSLLKTLTTVEETLATLPPLPPQGVAKKHQAPPITITSIPQLESLHKALVLYLWLSFRFELAFPDRELAAQYKARTEKVLEDCLERMPGVRPKKRNERTKAGVRGKGVSKQEAKPEIKWVERETAQRGLRSDKWRDAAVVDKGQHP